MATDYPEGFEPIQKAVYPEGFEPISQDASGVTTGFSNPATDRGSLGFPVSRDTARRISAERLVASNRAAGLNDLLTRADATELARQAGIPVGDIGEVSSLNQFAPGGLGDFLSGLVGTRAAASSAALNVPGAIGKTIEDLILNDAQKKILGSTSLSARAPQEGALGTTVGQLVPTTLVGNSVLSPGASLGQRMLAGAKVGIPVGAVASGASTVENQGLNTDLKTLIQNSATGGLAGGAVGAGLPTIASIPGAVLSVPSAISRAVSRVKPTATQSAMSALKFTEEEAQNILPGAVPRLSKAAGKQTPTTTEVLEAAPKARQSAFDETTSGLTAAQDEGLFAKGNSAFEDIANAITSDVRLMEDDPQAAQDLISRYEKYNRDIDPLEARKLLQSTNDKLISYWDKTSKGQAVDMTDAEVRAERAFAANLSRQVDDLYKVGSGKVDEPYRDIGRIIEFEKNLKLENEAGKQAFAQRVAPTRTKGGSSIPAGKVEAARRVGRGLTSAFRATEPELLDRRVKEIFRGVENQVPLDLPPEAIQEGLSVLREQYAPSVTTDTAPKVSRSLESQIQSLIATYPASLRKDPTLARLAAQQELGIHQ